MFSAKKNRYLVSLLGVMFIASAVAVGCNTGGGENGNDGRGGWVITPKDLIAAVGMQVCVTCHAAKVPDTPGPYTKEWLSGQHGNLGSHDGASGTLDSPGFPGYADFSDDTCRLCHDPLDDGLNLIADLTGNVPRPVVSCEACHGGGAEHFGVGDIPYPKPPAERCGLCHSSLFPEGHAPYHPNGDNIYENYVGSRHSISMAGPDNLIPGPELQALCTRCHTDEGFRQWVGNTPNTMSFWDMNDFFTTIDAPAKSGLSSVTCRTCHDGHGANADQLTIVDASNVAGDTQSSQFNTCTSCHLLVKDDGTVQTDPGHGDPTQIITDTHAAAPGDVRENRSGGAGPLAEVMYVKKGDEHSCAACHNPHNADTTENNAWSKSGHGDLGDNTAWNHYPWKDMGTGAGETGRQGCQRCHSSTGFMNFANLVSDGGTTYVPRGTNDYSYLSTYQYEALYCWACHAVNSGPSKGENTVYGQLRNPGQLPTSGPLKDELYDDTNALDGTEILLWPSLPFSGNAMMPDVAGSNICLSCHSGRENGAGTIDSHAGRDWSLTTSIRPSNAHHAVAGGVLFREIGFEYLAADGFTGAYMHEGGTWDYMSGYFRHDLVGGTMVDPGSGETVELYPGTGMNGPCVGCHMHANGDNKHLFNPVTMHGSTAELDATSCAACHRPVSVGGHGEMTLEVIEEEGMGFEAAHNVLKAFLDRCGFKTGRTSDAANNWTKAADASCTISNTEMIGLGNMGASFNWTALGEDGGAFVHNRRYTKRLIYDSIDWLDDNMINRSVGTTLVGNTVNLAGSSPQVLSGATLEDAKTYLMGTSGNRP